MLFSQMMALSVLHESGYELAKAIERLTPMATGAAANLYLRDQMEEWSIPEANLFEQALEQYSKDFLEIRRDFVRLSIAFHCIPFHSVLSFLFSSLLFSSLLFLFSSLLFSSFLFSSPLFFSLLLFSFLSSPLYSTRYSHTAHCTLYTRAVPVEVGEERHRGTTTCGRPPIATCSRCAPETRTFAWRACALHVTHFFSLCTETRKGSGGGEEAAAGLRGAAVRAVHVLSPHSLFGLRCGAF